MWRPQTARRHIADVGFMGVGGGACGHRHNEIVEKEY